MVKIGNIELPDFPLLLAPMEDVSDPPFRALCKENGADVVYTEFISSEGLIRDAAKSTMKLDIYEKERPVGIQIFGAVLESMLRSIEIVEASKPDIIDINFGCPVKKVVSKGAGAGILKDIDLMVAMIERSAKIFKERYQGKFYCLLWKERSAEKGIYAKILEGLKDKKVDVIEVEEIIPEYTQNYDKYLLYLDGHPNSFANARISEYLATFLEKENNHNVGISKSN